MGLTAFEIMHRISSPIMPNLPSSAIAELEDDEFITKVRAPQWAHEQVWPKLRALYEAGPVLEPHKFQPGDYVYVKIFFWDTLEPRWKGPFIVLVPPVAKGSEASGSHDCVSSQCSNSQ